VRLTGGTTTLANGAGLRDGTEIAGATLAIGSGETATSTGAVSLTSGSITGVGSLNIAAPFVWSGGTMAGAGTTKILVGASVTHDDYGYLADGRTLEVAGTLSMIADRGIYRSGTPVPLVHVLPDGLIRKSGSAGTAWIDAQVENDGTIDATAGTLNLTFGGPASSGNYGAPAQAGSVRLTGGTTTLANGAGLRDGTEIAGATLAIGSGETATAVGATSITGGTLSGAGTLAVTGTLDLNGSFELAGTLDLSADNGISAPNPGALLHVAATGVLRKSAGTGNSLIEPPLDNDGTLEARAGRLIVNGPLANYAAGPASLTGGYYVARAAELRLPGAVQTNSAHLVLDGSSALISGPVGQNALTGLSSNAAAGTLELDGDVGLALAGTLANAGTVRVSGTAQLTSTGDYRQSAGLTDLRAGGARLVASGGKVSLTGGRLTGIGSAGPHVQSTDAVVEPGIDGKGTLTLDTFSAGAGTTVRITVAGASAGAFGRLAVPGAAVLAGTLAIQTDPSFQPALGTQLAVVGHGARDGTFATVTGTDLGGGVHYDVAYGATDVALTVHGQPGPEQPPAPGPGAPNPPSRDADTDGDGLADSDDRCPAVPAKTVDGCPLPAPKLGAAANAVPVKGEVFVKLPAGAAGRARAAASGFIALSRARQIPMGSILDTRKGTVRLTTAAVTIGATQSGSFNGGLFRVLQSRLKRAKALTELRLYGGSFRFCTKARKRTIRSLRANARGRFGIRGRFGMATATARGTVWTVADRCDGTLTTVKRGTVVARDLGRLRNVIVRAGKSYLAHLGRRRR
jgi:hypothetical protein